jgi:hypothetical protein
MILFVHKSTHALYFFINCRCASGLHMPTGSSGSHSTCRVYRPFPFVASRGNSLFTYPFTNFPILLPPNTKNSVLRTREKNCVSTRAWNSPMKNEPVGAWRKPFWASMPEQTCPCIPCPIPSRLMIPTVKRPVVLPYLKKAKHGACCLCESLAWLFSLWVKKRECEREEEGIGIDTYTYIYISHALLGEFPALVCSRLFTKEHFTFYHFFTV